MAGGIILSNRLRAMQEAAANFGDSIDGIRQSQRLVARQGAQDARQVEQDKMEKAKFDQGMELGGLQLDAFKRNDAQARAQSAAGTEAQGFADQLSGIGRDVPEQAIGLPGMQAMQSPRPADDPTADNLKDRLRASLENSIAKSQGKVSALTAADIKAQRTEAAAKKARDEQDYTLGVDKTKADIESTKVGTAAKGMDAKKTGMEIKKLEKEIEAIGKGGVDPEKIAAIEGKLRGEFINQNKVFMDVRDAWSRLNSSNDDAAGDLSLIFNYMKMLDPGSTVREGEFATAQNATGIPERVLNSYNNALKGTRLSSGQRDQFKGRLGGHGLRSFRRRTPRRDCRGGGLAAQ